MGRAFADDLRHPIAFCIALEPFWYFAGDASSPGGQALIQALPKNGLLMPSPQEWITAAQKVLQNQLPPLARYTFSPDQLSKVHLARLFDNSPYRDRVVPFDDTAVLRYGDPHTRADCRVLCLGARRV